MTKKSDEKNLSSENKKSRTYKAPTLIEYGSLAQMTRTNTAGSSMDGGASPNNRTPMSSMCIGTVSALEEHKWLLADVYSQELFKQAISTTIKPGDIVLDLGCGSAIHSFFACEAGAKKVYALDSDSVIELAREAAEKNGFAHKIEFIFGHSSEIELPEKVDVIITNIGFLPTLENLAEACRRFLKPGGKIVPGSIRVGFAPIDSASVLDGQVKSWNDKQLGYDFSDFAQYAENRPWYDHLDSSSFLADPKDFPAIDLTKTVAKSYHWETEYKVSRDGLCKALGGWYTFELAPGVEMTTRPPMKISQKIWFNPVLPLSKPLELKKGDKLNLKIGFFRAKDPYDPIWTWEVEHNGVKIKQNSFEGMPLSKDLLQKLNPEQVAA